VIAWAAIPLLQHPEVTRDALQSVVNILGDCLPKTRTLPDTGGSTGITGEDALRLPPIYVAPKPPPTPQPKPESTSTPPPPPVEVPTRTPEPTRRLYHGTTASAVADILSQINLGIGKARPDFGQGFYTTANLDDAWRVARWKGGAGAVIVFDVPIMRLNSLNHLVFTSADSAWDNFILLNRSVGGLPHSYDWVEGPVAQAWDITAKTVTAFPYPEYHQLSIHTPAAAVLFQQSITGVLYEGN